MATVGPPPESMKLTGTTRPPKNRSPIVPDLVDGKDAVARSAGDEPDVELRRVLDMVLGEQIDVAEAGLAGPDLVPGRLGDVVAGRREPEETEEPALAVETVVVEDDLGVGGDGTGVREQQRVDLGDLAVVLLEDGVDLGDDLLQGPGPGRSAGEAGGEERGQPGRLGIGQGFLVRGQLDPQDLVRRFAGHLFDVDAAGRADDDGDVEIGGVHGHADVGGAARRLDGFLDEEPLDGIAPDPAAQHVGRERDGFGPARGPADAAGLAPPADEDQGLEHDRGAVPTACPTSSAFS